MVAKLFLQFPQKQYRKPLQDVKWFFGFTFLNITKSVAFRCRRVTRGGEGGAGLPCLFLKIGKKCPDLGKKCPHCGHLWAGFRFKMQFLRVFRQKNQ